MELKKDVIRRAADWLEANPDKHIAGYMAAVRTERGGVIPLHDPFNPKAECFCALGRIVIENGPDGYDHNASTYYGSIGKTVGLTYAQTEELWRLNDKAIQRDRPADAIALMRKIAA